MLTRIAAVCTLLALLASGALATDRVYKVVDEHGNVTFTDQKPHDGAEPLELPELSVMEAEQVTPLPSPRQPRETEEIAPLEFRIVSPEPEEHLFGTGNELTVRMSLNIGLPPGALVIVVLNGEAQAPSTALVQTFTEIPRGEHRVSARIESSAGRVLAETDEVVFYMRQASRLHGPPG